MQEEQKKVIQKEMDRLKHLGIIHGFMQLLCNRYFEVLVDHKAIEYCYIVGLGPNCKFIDLLFKRLVITFIYCSNIWSLHSIKSVPLLFHCFRNYLQSDRHTHRRTDVLEVILIRNLLMVNHTVVIASVTSLCNMMFYI